MLKIFTPPDWGAKYCDVRVCVFVFVCPRSYLWNYTSDLHQNFGACYLWPWLAVGMLSINDIVFAHNVPVYIATRKLHVLKVTAQAATPGAESAVCDCLV